MINDIALHISQNNIIGRIAGATVPYTPSGMSNWDSAYTNMVANSAIWQAGGEPVDISYLAGASGGWNSTEATVMANSGMWALSGTETDISELAMASGGWDSAEATVRGASGGWGGQIIYDHVVTAGSYADLKQAMESGANTTLFIPNGTYTITDNIAHPLVPHANCKLIAGQSREGVNINANSLSNITAVLYGHPTLEVRSVGIINNSISSVNTASFQGQMTEPTGHYTEEPIEITRFIDCKVSGFTGSGERYYNYGFFYGKCIDCFVDCSILACGFTNCFGLISCTVLDAYYTGYRDCLGLTNCNAHSSTSSNTGSNASGFKSSSNLSGCRSTGYLYNYYGCVKLINCFASFGGTGFETCYNAVNCKTDSCNYAFARCINTFAPEELWTRITKYTDCTILDDSDSHPIGALMRSVSQPSTRWKRCDGSVLTQAGYPLLYAQLGLMNDFTSFLSAIGATSYRMAYGNGRFVTTNGAYSTDLGNTWSSVFSGTTGYGIAYSTELNIWVIASIATVWVSSDNGATWTSHSVDGGAGSLFCVSWDGTRFIGAGGGGYTATSPDGINWTPVSHPLNNNIQAICYSAKRGYTLLGDESGNILKSVSGDSWEVISSASNYTLGTIWDISYIANLDCFILASTVTYGGGAFYSLDGGSGWKQQFMQDNSVIVRRTTTDGTDGYFLTAWGTVYKMGSDFVMRPVITGPTLTYAGFAYGGGALLADFSEAYVIRKILPSYNTTTSFRLPSPRLDAGITYDTWIKGD
jgi:hypothetical protein